MYLDQLNLDVRFSLIEGRSLLKISISKFTSFVFISFSSILNAEFADAKDFKISDSTTISLYGQINRGALYVDDGQATELFGTVDNDNSSTRFGIRTSTTLGSGWLVASNIEVQYEPASTFNINILDQTDSDYRVDQNNIRKVEISFAHKNFGKLSLGQGSLASDGAAEVDFSGTQVVSLDPRFVAGGQLFRNDAGILSNISISNSFNNFDTGRQNRVRYDTPSLAGFTLSGAVGHNILNEDDDRIFSDIALRYKNNFENYTFSTAAFFYDFETSNRYGLSAAVIHEPTGLNFRVAAVRDKNGAEIYATKIGLKRQFFEIGETALSVDYNFSNDLQSAGADSKTLGISAVQKIDRWNLELYGTYRNYKFDNTADNFQDINVVLTGARWKF